MTGRYFTLFFIVVVVRTSKQVRRRELWPLIFRFEQVKVD
jgi:hypothetical protein